MAQWKTVEDIVTYGDGPQGSNKAAKLAAYPNSPLYNGSYDPVAVFNEKVLSPEIDDRGHTFNTVDRDYGAAPDLSTVKFGGGKGNPGTPYSPDIGSATDAGRPDTIADASAKTAEVTNYPQGGGDPAQTRPGYGQPKETSPRVSSYTIGSSKPYLGYSPGTTPPATSE